MLYVSFQQGHPLRVATDKPSDPRYVYSAVNLCMDGSAGSWYSDSRPEYLAAYVRGAVAYPDAASLLAACPGVHPAALALL